VAAVNPGAARNERLSALDVGRGLAIVSVIYGHALAPWVLTAGENFNEAAFLQWKMGAAFMMPLFFFLSGLGWRDDKSFANTARQSVTLVLIALIASSAYDFARLLVSFAGAAEMLGGQMLSLDVYLAGVARMVFIGDYFSLSPLWFIVALAVVRLIAAIAVRLKPASAVALVVASVVLSTAAIDLDWRNFYQIKPLAAGLLFFLAGRHWRSGFHALQHKPAAAYALTLISAVVLVLTFHLNDGCRWDPTAQCGLAWLDGRFGVALIHGQIGNVPLFAFTAFAGIGAAGGLAILLARFGGILGRKLDAWGGNSLNLLIVNAGFLHVGNVFVDHWVVPNVEPGPLFFVALFVITLAANIAAAHVLDRPLRWLHRIALIGARQIVGAIAAARAMLAWAPRGDRVSQRND
jgi:fucose 4-O-acetylase-like acetyltransferase